MLLSDMQDQIPEAAPSSTTVVWKMDLLQQIFSKGFLIISGKSC